MKKNRCFVIIGYNKKPSYVTGQVRMLDLDQTYELLIRPVFEELDIPCNRAIDINTSGSIDTVMLQEIKEADIALADISTLNANVLWELGVRHALKPHHTIMICEKEQMAKIPFDLNHFVVHEYTHSAQGIPYVEVDRFRKHLKKVVQQVLDQEPIMIDSPVYTFLGDEVFSNMKDISNAGDEEPMDSFAVVMQKAEEARNKKDYTHALDYYARAKSMAEDNMAFKENLPLIISRQALCTYKLGKPTALESLIAARDILEPLDPRQTIDIEVIGLSGAINKRLNELTNDETYLNDAIFFYEKGFQLKQDYYNGINAAFMYYKKASLIKEKGDDDWEDFKLNADYIRNAVLQLTKKLEAESSFSDSDDAVWVLLTMAEAYNYKNKAEKMVEYEEKARAMAQARKDDFAMDAYEQQKEKIKEIFDKLAA